MTFFYRFLALAFVCRSQRGAKDGRQTAAATTNGGFYECRSRARGVCLLLASRRRRPATIARPVEFAFDAAPARAWRRPSAPTANIHERATQTRAHRRAARAAGRQPQRMRKASRQMARRKKWARAAAAAARAFSRAAAQRRPRRAVHSRLRFGRSIMRF